MKLCIECGEKKDISLFPTSRGKTVGHKCRTCKAAIQRRGSLSPESRRAKRAESRGSPQAKARDVLSHMRQSSKALGLCPPEFTHEEVLHIVANGSCAATGMPFILDYRGQGLRNPFAPSPDRIDPKLGYTKANVQWVCWMYNLMKGDHGQEDVDQFLDAIVRKRNAADAVTGR
jgi:hypothetical protein